MRNAYRSFLFQGLRPTAGQGPNEKGGGMGRERKGKVEAVVGDDGVVVVVVVVVL